MHGSYVNRISKVVMKMIRLVMIVVGIGMFIITCVLTTESSTNKMAAKVTQYTGEVENLMGHTIAQMNSLVMMMEQGQVSGYQQSLEYVDTIVAGDDTLSAVYIAYCVSG